MSSALSAAYTPPRPGRVVLDGWLAHQARTALGGYVGAMPAICAEVGGDVFASGRLGPDSTASGSNVAGIEWWNGESEGNWLLAWVSHAIVLNDEAALAEVRAYLTRVLDAQDDDGYIGMFTPVARAGSDYIVGDLWTQSRVLRALQLWAAQLDSDEVWAAVGRALREAHGRFRRATLNGEAFAAEAGDSCGRGHDLMIVEVLIAQLAHEFDQELLDFASAAYAGYSAAELEWPDADGQLNALLSTRPVVGHGAHTAEHLRIPLLLSAWTGDPEFRAAFDSGYRKMQTALGVGGALKSDETIGAPGSDPVPLPEAGYEFCAITELAITLLEAARITGDFAAVDRVERLFLNAAQAATAKDGRSVAYLVAENQSEASHRLGTRWDYSPTHDDVAVCCAPNAGRILPAVAERMIVQSPSGVSVQLFGPVAATVDVGGLPVTVTQETAFPFEETVRIRVEPQSAAEFEVEVRIPVWCQDPSVAVTGAGSPEITRTADRFVVRALWAPGGIVDIRLPFAVGTERSSDGRTALSAGPLLYSWPIASSTTAHRRYEGSDFADLDLVPAQGSGLYPPVLVGARLPEAELELGTPDPVTPWGSSAPALSVWALDPNPKADAFEGAGPQRIRLRPFGSTSLRWTAFTQTSR